MEEKIMIDKLIEDSDFVELVNMYNRPNMFRVMGKTHMELWHSAFICWLLDPNENHGLGIIPLDLLFELYSSKCNEYDMLDRNDYAFFTNDDYKGIKFQTEKAIDTKINSKNGRIDIFAEDEDAILIIENKIKSKQHDNQTLRYYEYFNNSEKYCNKRKYYMYLRVDKSDVAEDSHFINVTYQEIYDYVISKCIEIDDIKLETKNVLEQYAINLSNPLNDYVMAHTNKYLCEKIYCKNSIIIKKIRELMINCNRDEKSYVYITAKKYIKYINKVLITIGEKIITEVNTSIDKLEGNELISALCEYGIIIPNETEFICKMYSMTFIVKVIKEEGEYRCISGYCQGNYDGKQEVDAIEYNNEVLKTKSLTDAVDMAVMSYRHTPNTKDYDMNFKKQSGPGSARLCEFVSGKSIDELKELLKEKM